MSKLADKVIDRIKHKSGETAEIKFSATDGLFYCSNRFIGDRVQGADFKLVRDTVIERLKGLSELTWEPIIEVERFTQDIISGHALQTRASVNLRVSRYWIARRKKGAVTLRCLKWEDTETRSTFDWDTHQDTVVVIPVNRESDSREFADLPGYFTLPFRVNGGRWGQNPDKTFYAYSEPLWNSLVRICQVILEASNQLNALLESEQSEAVLTAWTPSALLLPNGD